MGFLNRGKRKSIPPNATFKITQEGREKAQEFNGDSKSRILVALETRGTSNVDEISQESGVSRGKAERILLGMMGGPYIQYVSAVSEDLV